MAYYTRTKYKVADEEGNAVVLEPGTEIKQGMLPDDVVVRGLEIGSIIKGDRVDNTTEEPTPSDNQEQETPTDE